jgi:putative sigma-54 modulation protein
MAGQAVLSEKSGGISMKLYIRGHHVSVTEILREYTARRFRFALSRFQGQIAEVKVQLSDENGPKGGRDKVCRVAATVLSRSLFVGEADSDLYAAISRAAERLGRAVSRELERNRVLRLEEFPTSTVRRRSRKRKSPQSILEKQ